MIEKVNENTWISESTATESENMFANITKFSVKVVEPDLSDHKGIFCYINIPFKCRNRSLHVDLEDKRPYSFFLDKIN